MIDRPSPDAGCRPLIVAVGVAVGQISLEAGLLRPAPPPRGRFAEWIRLEESGSV